MPGARRTVRRLLQARSPRVCYGGCRSVSACQRPSALASVVGVSQPAWRLRGCFPPRRAWCRRGPGWAQEPTGHPPHGAVGNPVSQAPFHARKGPLSWEPPIGIEPMTYALRGGLRSSTAVHRRHLGLVALFFMAADSTRIQARPGSLLALALARSLLAALVA